MTYTPIGLRHSSSRPFLTTLGLPLPALRAWLQAVRTAWNKRRTERLLESLPFDVRKDIGWPAADEAMTARQSSRQPGPTSIAARDARN